MFMDISIDILIDGNHAQIIITATRKLAILHAQTQ